MSESTLPQHLIDKIRAAYEAGPNVDPDDWDRKDEWWGYTRDHILVGATPSVDMPIMWAVGHSG